MKSRAFVIHFVLVTGAVVAGWSCGRSVTGMPCPLVEYAESEALHVAKDRLERFCNSKEIDCSKFSVKDVRKTDEIPWIVDFKSESSNNSKSYFFRVLIDKCGLVETSWQTYD